MPKSHWLFSKKSFLESRATGTTFKEISKSKELKIILSPLSEQKRIVQKIESIFGRIDAIEKQVDDSLTKLDQLKKSMEIAENFMEKKFLELHF